MRKWALSIITIGIFFGLSLLSLGLTNGIHNFFKPIIEIQSTSIGIAIIIVTILVFIYFKKYPEKQVKHPNAMVYGISFIIPGGSLFYWGISQSISEPQFATGYLVLGSLWLYFSLILGGLLIIESLRVYLKERSLKQGEDHVTNSKWGKT